MFCSNCGNEVSEKAFACPNCGCLINKGQANKTVENTEEKAKVSTLLKIFLLISFGLICLTVVFAFASIIFAYGDITAYTRYSTTYYTIDIYPLDGFAIATFITSICAFGVGVTEWILSFKEKEKVIKILSWLNFILSVTFIIIGVLFVSTT